MGQQKLTKQGAELIKYLAKKDRKGMTDIQIGSMLGVSRTAVQHIKAERRWTEIETPTDLRGEYLYLKHLNGEQL